MHRIAISGGARRLMALFFVGAAVLLASGCAQKDPVLAQVGQTVIRRSDFLSALAKAPRGTWAPIDSLDHAGRLDFLRTMIAKELLLQEALRRYETLPPEAAYQLRRVEQALVARTLSLQLAPYPASIPPAQVEDLRRRMSRDYKIQPVILDRESKARDIAAGQWTQESFNEVSYRETLEMTLEESMNKNRVLTVHLFDVPPPVAEVLASATPGQILGPIRLHEGWGVYRVDDIVTAPDSALADTTGLMESCRSFLQGAALWKATDDLLGQADIRKNEENLGWFQKLYAKNFIAVSDSFGRELLLHKEALIPTADAADRSRELARVAGEPLTVGDLLDEMAGLPVKRFPNVEHRGSIRLLVDEMILDRTLWREARRRGIPETASVRAEMAGKRRDIALTHLLDVGLMKEAKAQLDAPAYQAWYEANISRYMSKGPVRLALIYVGNMEIGVDLVTMLKADTPFAQVAAEARRREAGAQIIQDTGFIDIESEKNLYNLTRELPVGASSGPISMPDGRWLAFRILERGEPAPIPLYIVRLEVETLAAIEAQNRILEALVADLERKAGVTIAENKL
jgi:hypothetical protein